MVALACTWLLIMQAVRTPILRSALELAKIHGWTDRMLTLAVTQHNLVGVRYMQASARGLFPNGPYELIEHLFDDWDSRLQQDITAEAIKSLSQRERLIMCVRKRLEYEIPYKETWSEAMRLGADFDNFTDTAGRLWTTWALMLRLTGDESVGV